MVYNDIDLEHISEAALRRSSDAGKQKQNNLMSNKNYQRDVESFLVTKSSCQNANKIAHQIAVPTP